MIAAIIVCNHCRATGGPGFEYSRPTVEQHRAILRNVGWTVLVVRGRSLDHCPGCSSVPGEVVVEEGDPVALIEGGESS